LKKCPQCQTDQESDVVTSCPACGYNFAAQTDPVPTGAVDDDDDLDFQVYEQESDDREFVGGQADFDAADKKDDLGVQSPGEMMENLAHEDIDTPVGSDTPVGPDTPVGSDTLFEPIGQSAPFIPEPEPYEPPPPAPGDFSDLKSDAADDEPEPESSPNGIKKLSEEEVKAIESNLYHGSGYLSDSDKRDLMHKLDGEDQLFTATPIVPPKKTEKAEVSPVSVDKINEELDASRPSPKMANRGKGVAFYYRNYIQLRGSQHLTPEDELLVAGRAYELRPKTIDRKMLMGAGGFVFLLLLFAIGSLFVSSPSGNGRIAGIVLNADNEPFGQGATINLPELGERAQTNAEGMFVLDDIPSGSHRVELNWDGQTWGADYTTVVDNKVSMIVLRPNGEPAYGTVAQPQDKPKRSQATTDNRRAEQSRTDTRQASAAATREKPAPRKSESTPKSATTRKQTRTAPGRLVLAANVDGARITLDGHVLGAGNLTYRDIEPGTYRYEVSRDGYKSRTGKVTIGSGEQQTLAVNLERVAQETKTEEYTAEDFYLSGLAALQENDFQAAATDLREAVRRAPGNADANFSLGEAFAGMKDWRKAHDAFLRSAEQYRVKGDNSRAITAYNQAIQADDESIPAYLGRANLFLAQEEERAAVVDFESVIRLDKRNADAYFGLGKARFEQGLYDKAEKHFKDARSVDPSNPLVHQYLMLCYMADSDFDEVKKAYEKFAEVATPEEMKDLRSNSRFSAVMRVVDGKH